MVAKKKSMKRGKAAMAEDDDTVQQGDAGVAAADSMEDKDDTKQPAAKGGTKKKPQSKGNGEGKTQARQAGSVAVAVKDEAAGGQAEEAVLHTTSSKRRGKKTGASASKLSKAAKHTGGELTGTDHNQSSARQPEAQKHITSPADDDGGSYQVCDDVFCSM